MQNALVRCWMYLAPCPGSGFGKSCFFALSCQNVFACHFNAMGTNDDLGENVPKSPHFE